MFGAEASGVLLRSDNLAGETEQMGSNHLPHSCVTPDQKVERAGGRRKP
jgi:hypothetical protein